MQKNRRGSSSVRLTVTLSALSAIGIILGKFLALNVTELMRFSLENLPIIFAGVAFGPIAGGIVGAVQDLVGCIAAGYTINPIITLGSLSIGLVSGLLFRAAKGLSPVLRLALSVLASHAIGSVLIKSLGLAIFYSSPFGVTVAWRTFNYVIVGTAEVILLSILFKSKQLLSQINKIVPFSPYGNFKSVADATAYAKESSGVFSKPGLERVTYLLSKLANPERTVRVIHVAGTNGKGSTSAMLASILTHSGLKVGSFNSPYLFEMRESIRIGGEPISEGDLVSLLDRLSRIADTMTDKPTEFELLTAAAYLAFHEAKVDVAVVECGMGGEGDATNVISSPILSIITGISIDHTSFLGSTVAEIAGQKAGIIKHGCPVIVGKTDNEALDVIEARAASLSAPLTKIEGSYTVKELSLEGTLIDSCGIENIRIPLLGAHQPHNASLAVSSALAIQKIFPTVTHETIRLGIASTRWQARFEILSKEPLFIFDGAHNLEGVRSAVESIKAYTGSGIVYLGGVLADKEYEAMADEIAKVASHAVTVTPKNPRALHAQSYRDVLAARSINADYAFSIEDGVGMALEIAERENRAVVCLGSLYLYSDICSALEKLGKHRK